MSCRRSGKRGVELDNTPNCNAVSSSRELPANKSAGVSDFVGALSEGCGGLVEFRALPSATRRFFEFDDLAGMTAFCRTRCDENLYVGVATRRTPQNGTLENCQHLPALFVDVDFKDVPKSEARDRLSHCQIPPSIVHNSGGGFHVYWLLREPLDLATECGLAYRLLKGLAAAFDGDSNAAEPARVLRIPNTFNRKYTPPRPVTIEMFRPERRYNPCDFDEWLPATPGAVASSSKRVPLKEPIRKGTRNNTLYKVGRSLRAKGFLRETIAVILLTLNRKQCSPPLRDEEVERAIKQVWSQPNRAGLRASPRPESPLTFTDLRSLLREPDESVEWLVEDMVASASVNMIAAAPKVGKSTAARVLAFEVARGGTFLGRACARAPVWYVALEDKPVEVKMHFLRLGATGDEPVRFVFRQPVRDLLRQLTELAARERPGLIVVDTVQRLIGAKNLNDYAEVTSKLDPVLTLARETGAAVLLVHHAGKADRSGIDAVLGSTALAGSVDNVFLMRRTDRYRLLRSEQRIGPDIEDTVIAFDDETGNITRGSSKHDADVEHVAAELLAALQDANEPLAKQDWQNTIEARRTVCLNAVNRLVDQQKVFRTGTGKRGDPYLYGISVSSSQVPSNRGEPVFAPALVAGNSKCVRKS